MHVIVLVCFSILASSWPAASEDRERAGQPGYNPHAYSHSGITGVAYFSIIYCSGTYYLPLIYTGTLSIFSNNGRFVTTVTPDSSRGTFIVPLKPGTYVIAPDDPLLQRFRTVVTVKSMEFVYVSIALPYFCP